MAGLIFCSRCSKVSLTPKEIEPACQVRPPAGLSTFLSFIRFSIGMIGKALIFDLCV